MFVQLFTDGAHASIHHVAGRDEIRAHLGMTGRSASQQFQRGIVQYRDGFASPLYDAAMAVLHIFAQADVCDDKQFGQLALEQLDRLLDDTIGRVRSGGFGVLFVRDAKQ